MAKPAPLPSTLDPTSPNLSTSQVFAPSHTLPQIRTFHRSLTTSLDEKNARLRTLVGGSYRELLGTAETILQMRKDIALVEEKLGGVGEGCGRGVVGGKVRGLGKLSGQGYKGENGLEKGRDGRRRELEWVAKMKVLNSCGLVVGKILRRGAGKGQEGNSKGRNLVLAAKVLVLSRLLAKSLGDVVIDRNETEREALEEEIRRSDNFRKRLKTAIKRALDKSESKDDRDDIAKSLAAHSLATNSGAKDVLRHFLLIRGEAIGHAFEEDEDWKKDNSGVLRALKLYISTLLDVQALVPRRIPEALASLKAKALLKDEAIRELEGLRLGICEKWFGEEILHFTTYIRHDDLDVPRAVEMLRSWAKEASKTLLQGLVQHLGRTTDFKTVIEVRRSLLEIWIKDGGKAKGFDASIVLDGLRQVVNDRLLELLETRIAKLHLVGTEVEATLASWQPGITDKHESLWGQEILETEISNGADLFKQGILARTYGRNDAVSRVFRSYQTWKRLVDEISITIEQLKKQRWDDDLEDIEDDLSLESRNTLLSQEDPQLLQDRLNSCLTLNYKELHEKVESLLNRYKDDAHIGQISIYALRIIRDIRAELPNTGPLRSFGLSIIPTLHQQLALTVTSGPIEALTRAFARRRISVRALWEGSPELPVQPTPSIFKLFRNLSLEMEKAGSDVWSPHAVKVLKVYLQKELGVAWTAFLTNDEEVAVNGTKTNGENGTDQHVDSEKSEINSDQGVKRELLIQALFDLLVVQNSLATSTKNEDKELESISAKFENEIDLDASSRKRLQHGAKEYWKRTNLLFGLLA